MTANQRRVAERRVQERIEAQSGWAEEATLGATSPPWADELIRQFNEAEIRVCPHLAANSEQPSLWMVLLPDLMACQGRGCEAELVNELKRRLGHPLSDEPARCSACGGGGPVRGVSVGVGVGVGAVMIRGMVCNTCESREPGSPSSEQ